MTNRIRSMRSMCSMCSLLSCLCLAAKALVLAAARTCFGEEDAMLIRIMIDYCGGFKILLSICLIVEEPIRIHIVLEHDKWARLNSLAFLLQKIHNRIKGETQECMRSTAGALGKAKESAGPQLQLSASTLVDRVTLLD